jgi:hypothetical protein
MEYTSDEVMMFQALPRRVSRIVMMFQALSRRVFRIEQSTHLSPKRELHFGIKPTRSLGKGCETTQFG